MIYLIIISIIHVSTSVPIGGNVVDVRDWGRTLAYVNLIRQARGWGSPDTPGSTNISYQDPITGWPICDFSVVASSDALDMGGTYLLTAKGNGDVSLIGGS